MCVLIIVSVMCLYVFYYSIDRKAEVIEKEKTKAIERRCRKELRSELKEEIIVEFVENVIMAEKLGRCTEYHNKDGFYKIVAKKRR